MLLGLFCELNEIHFAGELPEPALKWNSRLSSSAGRFCPGSRMRLTRATIEVATYLRDLPDGEHHIRDTLLHEMVHYLLWHRNRPYGHTPEFHKILKRVGARRFNPVPKERKAKHLYQCPNCKVTFPARRKLGISACRSCCDKLSGGKFSERFRLQLLEAKDIAQLPEKTKTTAPEKKFFLPPNEIIRRLEALKELIRKKP